MNLLKQFDHFKSIFPASQSVRAAREQAHATVSALGLPTRKSEGWKYTSLKGFSEISWIPAPLKKTLLSPDVSRQFSQQISLQISAVAQPDFINLVFVNGEFSSEHSSVLPNSLSWNEIDSFEADSKFNFFESLQGVYFKKRYVLEIPTETSLTQPIHILSVNVQSEASLELSGTMVQTHLTVNIGSRSKISLVESFITEPAPKTTDPSFSNVLTRINLGASSSLCYLRVQRESDSAFHLGQTDFVQEKDSNLECLSLSLGGQLSRHQLQVKLIGSGATSQVLGAYVGRKNQHHDHQTAILHLIGGCSTQQIYKGLLDGKSRGVFNGKICIARGAQKAQSEQLNSNLLLSAHAEADSKPQLEIEADDVKATHGSTVGPLDPEELFYLLSRGIPRAKAIELLSFGFVAETVEKISNPLLKSLAVSHLHEVFQQLESVRL
jgi:Fe-S cluster assembly protein SufD